MSKEKDPFLRGAYIVMTILGVTWGAGMCYAATTGEDPAALFNQSNGPTWNGSPGSEGGNYLGKQAPVQNQDVAPATPVPPPENIQGATTVIDPAMPQATIFDIANCAGRPATVTCGTNGYCNLEWKEPPTDWFGKTRLLQKTREEIAQACQAAP